MSYSPHAASFDAYLGGLSGRTKKLFFFVFVALLSLLKAIGDHSGNTVRTVMVVFMTLALVGLFHFVGVSRPVKDFARLFVDVRGDVVEIGLSARAQAGVLHEVVP